MGVQKTKCTYPLNHRCPHPCPTDLSPIIYYHTKNVDSGISATEDENEGKSVIYYILVEDKSFEDQGKS